MADEKVTLSVFTADVGGFVGHVSSHPEVLDTAKERLYTAGTKGKISDFHILRCGDDINLVITHLRGTDDREIHALAWDTFLACRETAEELKLYGAKRGMLEDFTGNIKCMGPGAAEIEFAERTSEPVLVFLSNKTSVGSWNLALYKIFADPFNTSGLVSDAAMLNGFTFRLLDIREERTVEISTPEELHILLALAGSTSRYIITSVSRRSDGEIAAAISSEKYDVLAGKIGARCEPAMLVRCQSGFPAVGEVMEAFTLPYLVSGWMRYSHIGPLMPVPFYEANPTRFDGPPRVISAGFQISGSRLIGPHDMFDDPSFDEARRLANKSTEYLRRHGPFQPHRLPEGEAEYSLLPIILDKIKDRFRKV
ncbi:MAG TPA: fructose 1,6-bisphosphatase [Deltaproteobacteria bacterium]|nr:MAG: fructose 1,6-bisphosphatase [Deltaproteobacteria bacterium GWA2_55_82]OGQ65038.1 MAG: fructose 1,6-bisphosphatase [Deltaproteobacteria bacterium RIFCSPLOWO2_02_FULL_55_12]OIJ73772.1 MAG: fructose 1,6-bisphosphatase [Deltaproteobacteria bacterium GWC2_55_46]HBG45829.1 fructose 1,6-bisphosphatase [Deltaproteobacteria bacterium]HCY09752.1 fructose 1,6-bisphosphatase [Deltaproteobacteria bacterium]